MKKTIEVLPPDAILPVTSATFHMQQGVHDTVMAFGGYWDRFAIVGAAVSELGELAAEIHMLEGYKPCKGRAPRTEEELGDYLFTGLALANSLGIDAEAALLSSVRKMRMRDSLAWDKFLERQPQDGSDRG